MAAPTEKISSTFLHFSPLDLPIGYRFAPKDEELIRILHQRQQNVFSNHPIHHVNVYDSNPQYLSERFEKSNDKDEWFFMTERIKVCQGGKNQKRGNNEGYWLAKQPAKKIDAGNGLIGYMRQLVYMAGKKPNCIKTNWRMNEFYFKSDNKDKVDYALCKIFVTPMATKNANDVVVRNEEQQQVTWSPFLLAQDTQGQDLGGQAIVTFEPNPLDVFVQEREQQQQMTWSPFLSQAIDVFVQEIEQHQVPWSPILFTQDTQSQAGGQTIDPLAVFVQEGEQQQQEQQVTQSPRIPSLDPHDQDPELSLDDIIGPEDEDYWRWWDTYYDQPSN